jgi:hypothetical protein
MKCAEPSGYWMAAATTASSFLLSMAAGKQK